MPVAKLKNFLNENNIKYVVISHSPAYTAQDIAASAHIKGREIAKCVVVQLDDTVAMAVLPASHQIDFEALAAISGSADADLVAEKDFLQLFPDCEIGAMPPFGNLYNMPVYVAGPLTEDKEIAFNAGTHRELIKLSYADYERLVQPKVAEFSEKCCG